MKKTWDLLSLMLVLALLLAPLMPSGKAKAADLRNPLNSGGPDDFGYTFIDSNEPGGPVYAWEDISNTGTLVTGWTNYDNGYAGPLPIGFDFNFYGQAQSVFYIGTNGYISFGRGYSAINSHNLPDSSEPNNQISIFGSDLYLTEYGYWSKVYYQTLSNPTRLVVEFVNMDSCLYCYWNHTFEVILYPNGDVLTQYLYMPLGFSQTGIENADGTIGLPTRQDNLSYLAVLYRYPTGVLLLPTEQMHFGQAGDTLTYLLTLRNFTGASDSFNLTVLPSATFTTTLSITQTEVIANGDEITITVDVQIPPDAVMGEIVTATIKAVSMVSLGEFTDDATLITRVYSGKLAYLPVMEPPNTSYVELVDAQAKISLGSWDLYQHGCDNIKTLAIHPDGQRLWVGCSQKVLVLDRATGDILTELASLGSVTSFAFTSDGLYGLFGSDYGATSMVYVYDLATYTQIASFGSSGILGDVVMHPYLPKAYILNHWEPSGSLVELNTTTWSIANTVPTLSVFSGAISHDGARLFAAANNRIAVFDTVSLQQIAEIPLDFANEVVGKIAISADDQSLFATVEHPYDWLHNAKILTINTHTYQIEHRTTLEPADYHQEGVALSCDDTEVWASHQVQAAVMNTASYSVTHYISMPDQNGNATPDTLVDAPVLCPDYIATGLQLFPSAQSLSGDRGEIVVHESTLLNLTGITDTFTITLGAYDWDTSLSSMSIGPLDDGNSATLSISVTVPLDAPWYAVDSVTITVTSVTSPTLTDTATFTTQAYAPPQISASPLCITSTQLVNAIVTQTLVVTNTNGVTLTYAVSEELFGGGTPHVVALTANANQTNYANMLAAVDEYGDYELTEISTAYPGPEVLEGQDVLLLPDLDWMGSYLQILGMSFADALEDFLAAGGRALSVGDTFSQMDFFRGAGLMEGSGRTYGGMNALQVVNPAHPLVDNVALQFTGEYNTGTYELWMTIDPLDELVEDVNTGYTAVATRSIGEGYATLIGFDFQNYNADMARLLANTMGMGVGGDITWLSEQPVTGTVEADQATTVQVIFDSNDLQPGEYSGDLLVESNDLLHELLTLPVTMTVEPTASMGWVEGYITDAHSGNPLEATLVAMGQPYVITSNPSTGYYQFWLEQGQYMLQVSATDYYTVTTVLSITAQAGINHNFSLDLNVPVAELDPAGLYQALPYGEGASQVMTITNAGPVPLTFTLNERTASANNGPIMPRATPGVYTSAPAKSTELAAFAARSSAEILTDGRVLIIQNVYPWGYASIQDILSANGIAYDQINASSMSSVNLADYEMVIISSVQGYDFYQMWNANLEKFEDYVNQGGALWLSACVDYGDALSLPAGMQMAYGSDSYNNVLLPEHPWVAGVPNPFSGSAASHTYFTHLPAQARTIATRQSGGEATLVDMPFGDGRILLSGITLELSWMYGWQAAPILQNSLLDLYAWEPYQDISWLSTEIVSGTIPGYSAAPLDVTFDANGLQPGTYVASLVLSSNDPVHSSLSMPVTFDVLPTADLAHLTGMVTDAWSSEPLTATVELAGISTINANPAYSIWATTGTYTLTTLAPGYDTQTLSVALQAGISTTLDIALEPAQPRLGELPEGVEVSLVTGSQLTYGLSLTNIGPLPLTLAFYEINPLSAAQRSANEPLAGVNIMFDQAHNPWSQAYDYETLIGDLTAAGATITSNYSPIVEASQLAGYDILWVGPGGMSWSSDELALVMTWFWQGGRIFVQGGDSPATSDLVELMDNNYYHPGSCESRNYPPAVSHPIVEGVGEIWASDVCSVLEVGPGATAIFSATDDTYAHVLAQETWYGKAVVISAYDFFDWTIDYADNRLFAMNVFTWLAEPTYVDIPWLTETPISTTIAGHSAHNTTLAFDATNLPPGIYTGTLVIEHDSPSQESPAMLPIAMTVLAQEPALSLLPTEQSGSAQPGETVVYTFTLTNLGNVSDTFMMDIASTWDATLSVPSTGPLAPGEHFAFTVSVTVPVTATEQLTDTLTVTAQSTLDTAVTASAHATTQAHLAWFYIYMPIISKP